MRVVVEVTTEAQAELVALLTTRMPTEGDAVRFAAEFLEDIQQQFQEHEGPPPTAEVWVAPDGRMWWWRYTEGVWTGYTSVAQPRRLFRPLIRTFTVVAFRVRPAAL
jgi:hypothetical protein